ncbi:HigA family addiction module antitoxin [Paraburkholderia mimosarum]|uniref:HigA family addiction module antitoxin n=1 Tax=Paraburkholderia mimosarum TaxID=312026 RepID=UPI000401BB3F|nr:HigA family addiction module antitoxin [Paraburkholderia mimosarum]
MATRKTPAAKTRATKQVEAKQPVAKQVATKAPAVKPAAKQPARKPATPRVAATAPANVAPSYPKPGVALAAKIEATGMDPNKFARTIGVAPRRINEIIEGKRRLTADTALRLARYFGDEAMNWMALQAAFELLTEADAMADALAKIVPLADAGSATVAEAA